MASFNGFIRKSPHARLRQFFIARGVETDQDFSWSNKLRGAALVTSITELLGNLTDLKQDALKAELDLLSSLADSNGMLGAEQVCTGQGIDIEGLEGVQDILLLLAIEHPAVLDRVAVEASLMRRHGGKNWSAFQFLDDGKPWELNDTDARNEFLKDAISILDLPDHRKREADWYKTIRIDPITDEKTEIVQATIYVEERSESELAFGPSETLERRIVQKVLEVGVACNPKERVIEICAKGGKRVRDQYAASFAKHFAPQSEVPVETPRREVLLSKLCTSSDFETDPADGIEYIEVSSLDFRSNGGGYTRTERRGDDETLYQFLERRFGEFSPLNASGWEIVGATIRIVIAAREGQRRKTLTVTLRAPNSTTLPNKTEKDRQYVFNLLERWKLIAPPPQDVDVIEAA